MVTIEFDFAQPVEPKVFKTRKEAKAWIMQGFRETDGAEREHYADMLVQLESGKHKLVY